MLTCDLTDGPLSSAGCSQQLYKYAQTRWTGRLFVQMTLYVLFLVLSMGAGGMMPWILQHTLGYLPFHAGATSSSTTNGSSSPAFQHVYREEPGYSYINNNTYGYCKKTSRIGGEWLQLRVCGHNFRTSRRIGTASAAEQLKTACR